MSKKELKLNLGCGKRALKGYVNIDVKPFDDKVIAMDARNLEFEDESVDEIFASCILEHLSYYEIQETVWEWWRVLKFGGILKIVVPDFEEIARAYLNKEIDRETLHFNLFAPVLHPERQAPHLCTFDKPYTRQLLEKEGFEILKMKNKKLNLVVEAKKVDKQYLWR